MAGVAFLLLTQIINPALLATGLKAKQEQQFILQNTYWEILNKLQKSHCSSIVWHISKDICSVDQHLSMITLPISCVKEALYKTMDGTVLMTNSPYVGLAILLPHQMMRHVVHYQS